MALPENLDEMFDNPASVFEHHTLDPMTQMEHDAMKASAVLAQALYDVLHQDEATIEAGVADADWHEACVHLHALQAMVLRNAAARCYPQLYRQLGRGFNRP